jgi:hypothetical protein
MDFDHFVRLVAALALAWAGMLAYLLLRELRGQPGRTLAAVGVGLVFGLLAYVLTPEVSAVVGVRP